jgi:hypothetical protein
MFVLAALTANAFLSAFGGTWICTPHLPGVVAPATSTWTIAAAPKSSWVVVQRSSRGENAIGYVGYLAANAQWIFEDFQSDGSFSSNTSGGPQDGTWTWSGTFTSSQRVQHGAIQWRRDRTGFRQGFGRMLGTSFRELAYSTCKPTP